MTDQIIQRWAAAELAGDTTAMGELLAEDFRAVGPRGFVLDRAAWLERHGGGLSYSAVEIDDTDSRRFGDATVTVGVQHLVGRYREHALDERLRFTLVAVGGRIASVQMSPIQPPPGAPPAG